MSDTHGHVDDAMLEHVRQADEVWHAGDIGTMDVVDRLRAEKPLRIVYGNIDGQLLRRECPSDLRWEINGMQFWMTHIGGYANKLPGKIQGVLRTDPVDVFICGHSHICRVGRDRSGVLCMNPGAVGKHGFHPIRTMLRFEISPEGKLEDLAVIELGKRGAISS